MPRPVISIITVVFNGESTIEKTIQSVINQTYSNIEFVIIDGKSTDKTIEIIKKYENNITCWLSESDLGVYDAMNKGITISKGDWIYFLGSDDFLYDEQVIQNIFINEENYKFDFLYGNIVRDNHFGKYDGMFTEKKLLKKNISHQSIFYSKKVFELEGKFILKYKACSDWEFNIRCFCNKEIKIKYINIIVANFAKGGISSNYDIPFMREILIPQRILFYEKNIKSKFIRVDDFDYWWRLIRNAQIKSEEEVSVYIPGVPIPGEISYIIKKQQNISLKILKVGIVSKFLMMINYLKWVF